MYTEEEQRFKIAVKRVINEVDKIYLRGLQANSHECAAACCRDKESPTETLLECVETCGQELRNAQSIVLKEFEKLEDRFERCLISCEDFLRESKTGEANHAEEAVLYDGCVRRCVDTNIEGIPDILKAISEAFKKS